MMPEESHTLINGLHLAKNIVEHLKLNIGKRKLAEGDNFSDYGLWHARITGLFAEAGVKENLMIEVSRELEENGIQIFSIVTLHFIDIENLEGGQISHPQQKLMWFTLIL